MRGNIFKCEPSTLKGLGEWVKELKSNIDNINARLSEMSPPTPTVHQTTQPHTDQKNEILSNDIIEDRFIKKSGDKLEVTGGLMFPNRETYVNIDGFNHIHIHGGNRFDSYLTAEILSFIDTRENQHKVYANFGIAGLKYHTIGSDVQIKTDINDDGISHKTNKYSNTTISTISDNGISHNTNLDDNIVKNLIDDEGYTHTDKNSNIGIYADTLTNKGANLSYSDMVLYKVGDLIFFDGELLTCRVDFLEEDLPKTFDYLDWSLVGSSYLTGITHDNNSAHQTFSIENRTGISTFRAKVEFTSGQSSKTITFLKPFSLAPTMFSRFDKSYTVHYHNNSYTAGYYSHTHTGSMRNIYSVVVGRYLVTTTSNTITINRVHSSDRPSHTFDILVTGWLNPV